MDRLKSEFLGSLVGTSVGDSLGAGSKRYTDDMAMMIGVAESLVENKGFDAGQMVEAFNLVPIEKLREELWRIKVQGRTDK